MNQPSKKSLRRWPPGPWEGKDISQRSRVFYCALREQGPSTAREMAETLSLSRQGVHRRLRPLIEADLVFISSLVRVSSTIPSMAPPVYVCRTDDRTGVDDNETVAPRTGERTGCEGCGVECSTGKYCKDCKQVMRADRVQMQAAIQLAQDDHIAGREVSPLLLSNKLRLPLWDKRDSEGHMQKGLVGHLLRRGLLDGEWVERARLAQGAE